MFYGSGEPSYCLQLFCCEITYCRIREVGFLLAVSLGKHLSKEVLRVGAICAHVLHGYGSVFEDEVFSIEELLDTFQWDVRSDPTQEGGFAGDNTQHQSCLHRVDEWCLLATMSASGTYKSLRC